MAGWTSGMKPRIVHLDVTFRKAEDVLKLEEELKAKEKELERLQVGFYRFAQYAAQNLRLMDELRAAKDALDSAGLDSSFITSVQSRRKRKGR